MKDKLTLPILTLLLLLLPVANSRGQNINLPNFPGIKKLERGVNPGIAAGSHSGFYIRYGEDIGQLCSDFGFPRTESLARYYKNPQFRLNVFDTQGSLESLKRLRKEDEVQLAIIQSDLWHYADHQLHVHEERRKYRPDTAAQKRILDSWEEIQKNIALLLPLYDEKIHIVVRHDKGPRGDKSYIDLLSLFENGGARVNVGTMGSGTMVTCTMLNEIVTKGNENLMWKPQYLSTGAALKSLIEGTPDPDLQVDAVILVGGEPFPALEKWTQESISKNALAKKNLFTEIFVANEQKIKPRIDLLPIGRADAMFAADPYHTEYGYRKSTIKANQYVLLRGEDAGPVETRAVTACLVTHSKYDRNAGQEAHKIDWVQHILYRILSKLESDGLRSKSPPNAEMKWRETANNIHAMNKDPGMIKKYFGWDIHPDPLIRQMLSQWNGGSSAPRVTPGRGLIIDPDRDLAN